VLGLGGAASCLNRPVSELEPRTTNLSVTPIRVDPVARIDLLLVVDNSTSMQDKQSLLAKAVPRLVERLINPDCVDAAGNLRPAPASGCPTGMERRFKPVKDLHVGVISSSLGSMGTPACSNKASENDRAHLIATRRESADLRVTPEGFLAFEPETDPAQFRDDLAALVTRTGEAGCGYEAPLESFYRFLIDPEPPRSVSVVDKRVVRTGVDDELLRQRQAFLRPDSLLAIVVLTDENDCSFVEAGSAHVLTGPGTLRATAACAEQPNSACCRPCGAIEAAPPAGCGALTEDPGCLPGSPAEDPRDLRCYDQKRRFGVNFLQPIERYVQGLTQAQVLNSKRELVPNPLFAENPRYPEARPRGPGMVFFAGIVGVPWQDLATPESLAPGADRLVYQAGEEVDWSLVLGDPAKGEPPADPFMRESIGPRPTGERNPVTGDPILAPSSPPGTLNGREFADRSQLQFACTFPIPEDACKDRACDCNKPTGVPDLPLCQAPGSTQLEARQYAAKAFPGTRVLEVLKGLGDQGIVASVCPKFTDEQHPDFGYAPAMNALVERLAKAFNGTCLPRPVATAADGSLECRVLEATWKQGITCSGPYRVPVDATVVRSVQKRLEAQGECGAGRGRACSDYTVCSLVETPVGAAREACLTNPQRDVGYTGYCYLEHSPEQTLGNPALLAGCPTDRPQMLRFVQEPATAVPAPNSVVYVACLGKAVASD
jgi:hypothetical protein